MSEEFVRSVLKEHVESNMPRQADPWHAVQARVQGVQAERRPRWGISPRPVALAFAGTLVLVLAVVGMSLFAERPKPVSAEEIFAQAEKVSKDASAGGLRSGYMVAYFRSRGVDRDLNVTDQVTEGRTETWYVAPDKLFGKSRYTGTDGTELEGISLELGDTIYAGLAGHEEVRIMPRREDATRSFSPLNTEQLFSSPTNFGPVEKPYTVTLVGNEQVIGREAYVLEWNVTPEVLKAEAAGGFHLVRHKYRLWIDQQFYLVLKLQAWNKEGVLLDEHNVETLELNKPVDPSLFEFEPPAGYVVADMRPASAKEVAEGWREASKQVAVTLYEPGDDALYAPELRKPYYVATQGVVTQALVRRPRERDLLHAVVVQGPPSAIDESRLGSSTPVQVGARQGRLYRKNEAYHLVFDIEGTRIMLYSSNSGGPGEVESQLVRIGESLRPVGKK